ncbi:MAG: tRNA pseudouridine(13) synthase TruD [Candidatus Diapherotrites archaeon]|nr:tRNA pseudouridine(13) synthase TruD [Candidatus Diapherotrites archaeon]
MAQTFSYGTTFPGTGGQIKRRYTDFIVEEIQTNGTICEVQRFIHENQPKTEIQIPENKENLDYLNFDLEKINIDAVTAMKVLSRTLQVSIKRIGYAGLKDKRGITCQRINVWKPNAELLKKKNLWGMDVRNFEWSSQRIELGMLQGNQFTITVRNIELDENELKKRLEICIPELSKGIPNYFGGQRFGGNRSVTHIVGKYLVLGKVKEAVLAYLTVIGEKEDIEMQQARKNLGETLDYAKALKEFSPKASFELALLNHLVKNPNDFSGALQKLPKKIRYLLTHAYQSHIFNQIIQERIHQGLGIKAIPGEPVNEQGIALVLLPGYDSQFTEGKIGEIEKQILEKEQVQFEDFRLKVLPECSCKGTRKEIALIPENFKILKIQPDEFNAGKLACVLQFSLSKGNYATTVLQEITKSNEME